MIDKLNPKKCTGCFACAQKCPRNCIHIVKDVEGFYVPQIEMSECIGCEVCEKTCPQMNPVLLHKNIGAYAARMKNDEVLKLSTSGGIFAAAAIHILNEGGVVFGVEMTAEGVIRHTYIDSVEQLPILQGSKYVQSIIGDSYVKAKEFLVAGRSVLFSGTPCQIAGLRNYLQKTYDNLYTMDVICHGVPSQDFYLAYREWLEKKHGQKIKNWNFRDKSAEGWNIVDKVYYEHKTVTQREMMDPFTRAFLDGYTYRESCYQCLYARGERIGDLTGGDYWGIKRHHPEFFSEKGISLLLVNTEQGKKLFDKISENLLFIPSKLEWMQEINGNLKRPTIRSTKRDIIYTNLHNKSMSQFVKEDLKVNASKADIARSIFPYKMRKQIKRLLSLWR